MKTLLDYSVGELEIILSGLGEPKYRAKQIFRWLHKGVEINGMSDVSVVTREKLAAEYIACSVKIERCVKSAIDGTKKYAFALGDGNIVEGVLMSYKYGATLCVSTQVGCRMGCAFCASGLDGLIRNLTAGEILGQIIAVNREVSGGAAERAITNVVLMGSGEPLDNYDNVIDFLRLLSDPNGINIGKRNVSLSTCGLAGKIINLADSNVTPTLTVSLHGGTDATRKKLMPIANKYSMSELKKAMRYYFEKSGRRVIIEYALVEGVNDGDGDAEGLIRFTNNMACHVNLIRLNRVEEKGLKGSAAARVKEFKGLLEKAGVSVTLRRTMGVDIEGACGQLRRKIINNGGGA